MKEVGSSRVRTQSNTRENDCIEQKEERAIINNSLISQMSSLEVGKSKRRAFGTRRGHALYTARGRTGAGETNTEYDERAR